MIDGMVREYGMYENELYALPFMSGTQILLYQKTCLKMLQLKRQFSEIMVRSYVCRKVGHNIILFLSFLQEVLIQSLRYIMETFLSGERIFIIRLDF